MATVQDVYERHFPSGISPSSWEVWSWFFMRVSGLVLIFLGLLHVGCWRLFDVPSAPAG